MATMARPMDRDLFLTVRDNSFEYIEKTARIFHPHIFHSVIETIPVYMPETRSHDQKIQTSIILITRAPYNRVTSVALSKFTAWPYPTKPVCKDI